MTALKLHCGIRVYREVLSNASMHVSILTPSFPLYTLKWPKIILNPIFIFSFPQLFILHMFPRPDFKK